MQDVYKNELIKLLDSYLEKGLYFDEEKEDILNTKKFVEYNENFRFRDHLAGHITNSAWIISSDYKKALLIHHKKLDKWFQPGGHCEKDDLNLQDGALREIIEETGIKDVELINDDIFDIDIHTIPAKGDIPEHLHYDIRFIFKTDNLNLENFDRVEVNDIKWISLENLLENEFDSINRMALKTIKLRE